MGCIPQNQYNPFLHEIISVHNTEGECNEECGVCCINSICVDNNQTQCAAAGGIWYSGVSCEDVICPSPSPSISPSPSLSVTPSISITPSLSITPSPFISPIPSLSVQPSPSQGGGVCCIPQCDEFCSYCETYVAAPRAHGTYVVTGDVTITYTDPINQCDPWHGGPWVGESGPPGTDTTNYTHTFTINGTYTYDSLGYWTNNSDNRVYINGSQGSDTLGVWIDSPNNYGWPIIIGTIHTDGVNSWTGFYGGMSWEPSCGSEFDWGDFTVGSSSNYYPTTIDPETGQCVPDYDSPSPFPAGFTITGSTINIKFIPSTENQSVCENAGGMFWGLDYWGNTTPNPDQAVDSCLFQTYAGVDPYGDPTPDPAADCPPPINLGGNYFDVNDPFSEYGMSPYSQRIVTGSCCEGICSPNYIKVQDDTVGYCMTINICLDFSPVPNTNGCSDTISESACTQGGVYSPVGVPIGTWYPGENCTIFDCNA
jgi:hypothetical protein